MLDDQTNNQFDTIESSNSKKGSSNKTKQLFLNSKEAVIKTLNKGKDRVKKGITSSALAACLTGGVIAPGATTGISAVTLGTGAALTTGLVTGCEKPEPERKEEEIKLDIRQTLYQVDITGGAEIRQEGNSLKIGNKEVATRSHNRAGGCSLKATIDGQDISLPCKAKAGTLKVIISCGTVKKTVTVTLTETVNVNKPPTITRIKEGNIDVSEGKVLTQSSDYTKILLGNDPIFSLADEDLSKCKISFEFEDKDNNKSNPEFGDNLKNVGKLTATIKDSEGLYSSASANLEINNKDPNITIYKEKINNLGEIKAFIVDNTLILGKDATEEPAAEWSDDRTENCDVSITFKKKEGDQETEISIDSGNTLPTGKGNVVIAVDDKEGGTNTKTIEITDNLIYGLDNIESLLMQLDKEINLLQGVTFPEGITLEKVDVEIDGKRYGVSDPSHFIPEIPGSYTVILTININGESKEISQTVNKTVDALDYNAPSIETTDIINEHYEWYNTLCENDKNFILPHILVSYISSEWYKMDNLEYIIACEVPKYMEYVNVGNADLANDYITGHADNGYTRIIRISPQATVKFSSGTRQDLYKYVKQHPEKILMISCAGYDSIGTDTKKDLQEHEDYKALQDIINQEHVTMTMAIGNTGPTRTKTLNENEKEQQFGAYTSASVNSNNNNKYTIVGYDSNQNNVFGKEFESCRPVGFSKNTKNIVIPFIQVNSITGTQSSMPTAGTSATIGNHLPIIIYNNPGFTASDANNVIVNNYFDTETFQYIDEDGSIKNGEQWNFFKDDKFINNEALHKPEIDAIQLDSDDVKLPAFPGGSYVGKGIQFEYEGKRYSITNANMLDKAIKSGEIVQYYWNKKQELKYGGKGTAEFDVYILNKSGKKIPNAQLKSIKKPYNY